MFEPTPTSNRKRIAVIGAGPAGLVALKTLIATREYQDKRWEVIAFEQRTDIGGIWLPDPSPGDQPQTPLYNSLTTNLPHPIMAFRDFPFPHSTPLYPKASVVLQYLQDYVKGFHLHPYIRFSTYVTSIKPYSLGTTGVSWNIATKSYPPISNEEVTWTNVNTIVIANGRHGCPFYPSNIDNFDVWKGVGKVSHSMTYREPTSFRDKSVIVVGNGPSALDISPELVGIASRVYRSIRKSSTTSGITTRGQPQDEEAITICRPIREFGDVKEGVVVLDDGKILSGVDHVIFATGYDISTPFLGPPVVNKMPNRERAYPMPDNWLINSGQHLFPLTKHMIPTPKHLPLGSFFVLGLPRPIVPFPFIEIQCHLVTAILSGKVEMDIEGENSAVHAMMEEMLRRFDNRSDLAAREWHRMDGERQFDYRVEIANLTDVDPNTMIPEWQRRVYARKLELRKAWKEIEKKGEDKRVTKDVGKGGEHEWVELMDRILEEIDKGEQNRGWTKTTD
ncbi:hypothetical protein FRB91_008710 [Serendipita sp. 411]|nr:hypothetical protein FRB91_008710 [Serendipita sp. 411]